MTPQNIEKLERLLLQNQFDLRLHFRDGTSDRVAVQGMVVDSHLTFARRVKRNPIIETMSLDEIVSVEPDAG